MNCRKRFWLIYQQLTKSAKISYNAIWSTIHFQLQFISRRFGPRSKFIEWIYFYITALPFPMQKNSSSNFYLDIVPSSCQKVHCRLKVDRCSLKKIAYHLDRYWIDCKYLHIYRETELKENTLTNSWFSILNTY